LNTWREDCAEEAQRDKTSEGSVELFQEGIERVQGVHQGELCFELCEKRSVQEKTLTEFLNTLDEDLCKECTRKTLGGSVERLPSEGQSERKECA
jgi:hypothetical protein